MVLVTVELDYALAKGVQLQLVVAGHLLDGESAGDLHGPRAAKPLAESRVVAGQPAQGGSHAVDVLGGF